MLVFFKKYLSINCYWVIWVIDLLKKLRLLIDIVVY